MAEYIKKEVAIAAIESKCIDGEMYGNDEVDMTLVDAYDCIDAINDIPTADVAPVVHGKWIKRGYVCGESEYECSACHETEWRTSCSRFRYCPFCGAKMDFED